MTNTTKPTALVAVLLMVAGSVTGQTRTRLEVLTTPDRQKAQAAASQLDSQGYGPMEVRQSGDKFQVLTKAYESVAEANLVKPRLLGADFLKTRLVTEADGQSSASAQSVFGDISGMSQALKQPVPAPKAVAPGPKLTPELRAVDNSAASQEQLLGKMYGLSNAKDGAEALQAAEAFLKRFPGSERAVAVKMARAHLLDKKKDYEKAFEQFADVAREHAGKPEAGEAELRCGFEAIHLKKPDAEVLGHFRKVASGQVTCTPQVRLNAMVRCAALYHKGRDLDTAQAAYQAVFDTAADMQTRANAKMQLAAITLEKARSKKATYAQARQLCDEMLKEFPDADKAVRATAGLMVVETLAYEKEFAKVLERESAYLEEFKGTREAQLAYYWFALAHFETGDTASAKAILSGLLEADFPTHERFKMVNVTASAKALMARIEKAEQAKQQ